MSHPYIVADEEQEQPYTVSDEHPYVVSDRNAIKERRQDVSATEDFAQGVNRGLGDSGYSLAQGLTWLARQAGRVVPGPGGAPSVILPDFGESDAEKYLASSRRDMQEYYDPQGAAGMAGTVAGRVAGEGALLMLESGAVAKGAQALAPASRVARAIDVGRSGNFAQRLAAQVLPGAPLDFVVGAGDYTPPDHESTGVVDRILHPRSRVESGLVNVGIGAVLPAAIEGTTSLSRVAREAADVGSLFNDVVQAGAEGVKESLPTSISPHSGEILNEIEAGNAALRDPLSQRSAAARNVADAATQAEQRAIERGRNLNSPGEQPVPAARSRIDAEGRVVPVLEGELQNVEPLPREPLTESVPVLDARGEPATITTQVRKGAAPEAARFMEDGPAVRHPAPPDANDVNFTAARQLDAVRQGTGEPGALVLPGPSAGKGTKTVVPESGTIVPESVTPEPTRPLVTTRDNRGKLRRNLTNVPDEHLGNEMYEIDVARAADIPGYRISDSPTDPYRGFTEGGAKAIGRNNQRGKAFDRIWNELEKRGVNPAQALQDAAARRLERTAPSDKISGSRVNAHGQLVDENGIVLFSHPAIGGAVVGATTGGTQGDTPEERARNAVIGATIGVVGVAAAKRLGGAASKAEREVAQAETRVSLTPDRSAIVTDNPRVLGLREKQRALEERILAGPQRDAALPTATQKPIVAASRGEEGITLYANPIGPALRPAAKVALAVGGAVRDLPPIASLRDAFKRVVDPVSRSAEAGATGLSVRAHRGQVARDFEQASAALDKARDAFEKMPVQAKHDFIARMERGGRQATTELQAAADVMRTTLDKTRDEIRALGTGALDNFIDNYFPHIWKDPSGAKGIFARVFGTRPLEGPKSFLKERTIPTFAEGIQKGLEPVSSNPVDLTLLKLREMQRFLVAHRVFNDLHASQLLAFVPSGNRPALGYARIQDKMARVFGRNSGEYWAPEPVARVLNNYLSPGLVGSAPYDMARQAGNFLTQAQLGLSAFHLGFTSVDAITSKVALGIEQLAAGRPLQAAASLSTALAAPVTNVRLGSQVRAAYLDPSKATNEMREIAQAVADAGGRIKMDGMYRNSAPERWIAAMKEGHYGSAAALTIPSILEMAAKPILEWVVPRQKLGVFADLARFELSKLPANAAADVRRGVLAKVWDSVDNRMGQLVYDNLFWDRTFKDLTMLATRSVGWNVGTARELGGGIGDIMREGTRALAGKQAQLTHRAAYVAALPVTVGMLGAIIGYASGHPPETLKDYFYPRTGSTDANGNPERVQIPSYMKDLAAYAGHPWQTIKHKASPIIGMTAEALENENFYGDMIRNPDDPAVTQFVQLAKHFIGSTLPFAIQNAQEARRRGDKSPMEKYGSFVGLTPAPRSEVRTDAENRMYELLARRRTIGSTPEDSEARRERTDILRNLRGGELVADKVHAAIESGSLNSAQLVQLLKRAGTSPFEEQYKRLTVKEAVDVYKRGTPEQQAQMYPILGKKINNAAKRGAL